MESNYLVGEIANMIYEDIFFHFSEYCSDEIIQIETMEDISRYDLF